MLAVQIRKPGPPASHQLEEVTQPVPGPLQVVIDVKAAAVNYPDLLVATGLYQTRTPYPFTPGKDGAGVIRSVGAGVKRFKPGDRVLVHLEHGTFATQALSREDQCMPLPAGLDDVNAVSLGLAAQTAWFALMERGGFEPGNVVLVNGATGAVGHAAVQIAAAMGGVVLAAASSVPRARQMLEGVNCHFIDLSAPDLRDSLREQVLAASGGKGADVIIDPLGADVFDASMRALAWCGRIVSVGFAAGRIPQVKANYLLVKNIAALGLQWTDYRDRQPWLVAKAHEALTGLWERGHLRSHVMCTLPLAGFAQALELIESRKATGRIVLTMD